MLKLYRKSVIETLCEIFSDEVALGLLCRMDHEMYKPPREYKRDQIVVREQVSIWRETRCKLGS